MFNWITFAFISSFIFAGCNAQTTNVSSVDENSTPPINQASEQSGRRLVRASGWPIPSLPEKKYIKSRIDHTEGKEITSFTAYYRMGLIRFKEPFDALGLSRWGRLDSVTEFLSADKKPFCYTLTAETDWEQSNQRVGALIKIYILDSDGDGVFETLSDRHICQAPEWVK